MGESAAALVKNGILVAAVEEERFTRIKHEGCFPLRSIEFCLAKEGIRLSDVSHVGVYWQPWRVGTRLRSVLGSAFRRPGAFIARLEAARREFSPAGAGKEMASHGSWLELFNIGSILERNFGSHKCDIRYLDHHRCHMASAFFASPFEEATVLTIDGAGEEVSTTLAVGTGRELRVLRHAPWPNSLGHFYSTLTGYLGLGMLDGEYKMMGLAPYGKPTFLEFLRRRVLVTSRPGEYQLNDRLLDYHAALAGRFSQELIAALGPPRLSDDDPFTERHQDIAASAQAAFEEVILDLAAWAYEHGGRRSDLVISGGCGLNCTANGKLLREGPFKRIYVPSAPHDAGCAIGAALLVNHETLGGARIFEMTHAYYGPSFDNAAIRKVITSHGIASATALRENELLQRTVTALEAGQVVGWFQGAMEFGPRALGARSFLADARNDSIRGTLNQKIKKRELFRPFAPSVKRERAAAFFDAPATSPFMNITVPVRPECRSLIPAVTHVDGTARIQTVDQESNPRYWSLLDLFERRTGVPVLLNTSFNIQEPIVCTPEEAIRTFRGSRVDALAIGDFFVTREMLSGTDYGVC
jgi:carbamoyltransferase